MTDKIVDPRSLCGIKGCENRATYLIAWPKRYPVPFCGGCWTTIKTAMAEQTHMPPPGWWLEWMRQNGKPHLFREESSRG